MSCRFESADAEAAAISTGARISDSDGRLLFAALMRAPMLLAAALARTLETTWLYF